jgi:hypothetical protein
MTAVAVLAGTPVSVITANGKQHGIPLSLLAMQDGAVDTSRLDPALAAAAGPTLKALVASGAIRGGTASAPVKSMALVAKFVGIIGNEIELTFSNVNPDAADPAASTCDLRVQFNDQRTALTVAAVAGQLGAPADGTVPSLVKLKAAPAGLPAATAATKLAGSPRELAVPLHAGGGNAMTFQAATGPLLADLSVAIIDVDATANTFTLVISLDHTAVGIALSALATRLAPLVTVTPGAGGFAAPAEGIIRLKGGAPSRTEPPTVAAAEVLSG